MARTLKEHLADRMAAGYRQLLRSLSGVTPEQAAEGAREEWKRYRYGEGLDGSLGGITLHLAVWKHVTAAGLETGEFPASTAVVPEDVSWEAVLAFLKAGQRRFTYAVTALTDADLDRQVEWEGHPMTIEKVVAHLVEHDHYHAGQINLLRQLRGHPLTD